MMDVTMMALLCLQCHHDGCHRHGTAGPTLSPQWVSLWQRRCANAVTMMDITVMAVPQCHRDGRHHCTNCVTMMDVTMMDVTAVALLYQHCHCNGCHHGSPAVPTLSP